MRHKIFSLLLILALVVVGSGFGQTMKKTGNSGAAILKVPIGAKATALGGAVTTEFGDVNQMFYNPAGIAIESGKTQFTFSYNNWIADLSHNAFGISHTFGNIGTFALGGMMAGVSGIEADRDLQPGLEGVTYNTSATFDYNTNFIQLTYAKQFTNKLSLGVSTKYFTETIDDDAVHALAVDFGVVYFIGYRDLAIGGRIQNFGQDAEYFYVPFKLPLVFSFGVSMSAIQTENLNLKGYVDATKPIDNEQLVYVGGELNLYKAFYLRGGWKFNYLGMTDEFTPYESYQLSEGIFRDHWWNKARRDRTDEGISFGAGIDIPYGDYDLSIDYAYTAFNLLDNVNRFSLTFTF
ncbi:PorV/PorQ family protein [candidate division KSB1 bacterium]|nr:PorV/PorQ family protein [candidate division KSB1 bacterium]